MAQAPNRTLALIEVKASASVGLEDFRHADWFLKEGPGAAFKGAAIVVYLGDQILSFGSGRLAAPLSIFWSFPNK